MARKPFMRLLRNMRLIVDTSEEWIGTDNPFRLIQDIRKDQSLPVLVLIPPKEWAQSGRKTSLEKSILRFVEREGVDLINLHPVFMDAVARDGLETYYIKNDWHWTPKGARACRSRDRRLFWQRRN